MAAIADEPGLGITRRRGWFHRPTATTGFWGWITTVDHKKIGILYGVSAFVFFLIGGMEALLIRMQLARPAGKVVTAQAYNEIFTMHGLTMIFLVVMPLGAAFVNYLVPLMIGAPSATGPSCSAGCSCTRASSWAARRTAAGSATSRCAARPRRTAASTPWGCSCWASPPRYRR